MWAMVLSVLLSAGVGPASENREVVVYCALDRPFAEPILQDFEKQTGIKVKPLYDAESTKTVGLVNKIRAEQDRPQCDFFWNNEIVNTLRLQKEGLLQPVKLSAADQYPEQFRDPQGHWYGFAARARVIIINTDLVKPDQEPKSLFDLTQPQWKGQIAIAKPLFGTTASHIASLYATLGAEKTQQWLADLQANEIHILSGNKQCAESVGSGQLRAAMTDTDDAMIELRAGKPVKIIYPDSQPDQMGTLFLPNTLMMIKNAPHAKEAEQLMNYLLTLEVETRLAEGESAQIPLHKNFKGQVQVMTPQQIKALPVDFAAAAQQFETAAEYLQKNFIKQL
ncbi:MAG: Iron deficiency-induced protein A [Phycisphaerae bacterium]|nr:Iron deficiency-induced protein A [Phycisphaerae bacterium]